MWDASKCNLCGDCLVKCLYVDYDKDKAVVLCLPGILSYGSRPL